MMAWSWAAQATSYAVALVLLLGVRGGAGQACDGSVTLDAASGFFSDGSAAGADYGPNLVCSWIIFPPANGYDTIQLTFARLDTEPTYDSVRLFRLSDSGDVWEPTGLEFSGSLEDMASSSVSVAAVALKVEFISDSSIGGGGFAASFLQSVASADGAPDGVSCHGTTTLTDEHDLFTDGSEPAANYSAGVECTWIIAPAERTSKYIELDFSHFDVADNGADRVLVYELGVSGGWGEPLAVISGTYDINVFWNNTIATQQAALKVVLVSSAGTERTFGNGFRASYYQTDLPRTVRPAPAKSCTGELRFVRPIGRITDGSAASDIYSPNLACSWVLAPAATGLRLSHGLRLEFTRLDVQENFDFVRVFAGPAADGPWARLAELTGTLDDAALADSAVFATESAVMKVEFSADASQHKSGFAAHYWQTDGPPAPPSPDGSPDGATCMMDNGRITEAIGRLSDGSGVYANYSAGAECSWVVRPSMPAHYGLHLRFDRFDTEENFDFVRLYELNDAGNEWIGPIAQLSGKRSAVELATTVYYTPQNALKVQFVSDNDNGRGGFAATYWPADRELVPGDASATCSGARLMTAPSGAFGDGSGAAAYGAGLDCSWVIWPADRAGKEFIELAFSEVDTEPNADYVSVYELSDDGDGWVGPLAQLSGSSVPGEPAYVLTSSAAALKVDFTTSGNKQQGGFAAAWRPTDTRAPTDADGGRKSCDGTVSLPSRFGVFTDGSAEDEPYSDDLACEWVIAPTGQLPAGLEVEFVRFDTELFADVVTVFERRAGRPVDEWDGPLIELSGMYTPGGAGEHWGVKSSDDAVALKVVFSSNTFRTRTGFAARYAPQLPPGRGIAGPAQADRYMVVANLTLPGLSTESFTDVLRSVLTEALASTVALGSADVALVNVTGVAAAPAIEVDVELGLLDANVEAQRVADELLMATRPPKSDTSARSTLESLLRSLGFPELRSALSATSPVVVVVPGQRQDEPDDGPVVEERDEGDDGQPDIQSGGNEDADSKEPDATPQSGPNVALIAGVTVAAIFCAVLAGGLLYLKKRRSNKVVDSAAIAASQPAAGTNAAGADIRVSTGMTPVKKREDPV
eukprot:jgi/Tetstr1/449336/TSEL_003850.t1